MSKYLQITATSGVELIPIGDGLFVEQTSATAMRVYSAGLSGHHFALVTTGGTVAMIDSINAALKSAAQTSWMNAVIPVALPSGEAVTSISVAVFA
tara:strand:+ start:815 stop:1102 length:288 start_codon:yes stop_codon:yes gene_type:complete